MKSASHELGLWFFLLCFFFLTLPISYVSATPPYNETVYQVQKALKESGYKPGLVDGLWGKSTENAIKHFQKDYSLPVTGEIDSKTKSELGLIPKKSGALNMAYAFYKASLEKSSLFCKEITAKPYFNFFLLGGLLTVALYNFFLSCLRVKGISMLYLGVLSVLIAFLCLQSAGITLLPYFNPETAFKIEFITVCLFFTIFAMLIESLYQLEFSRKALWAFQTMGVLFAISVFVTSGEIRAQVITAFGGIVSFLTICLFYVLARAVIKKREGAMLFLAGFLFLFTVVSYGFFYDQVIYKNELVPLGVFIVIFSQSFSASMRFSKPSNREVAYERFVPKKFLINLGIDDIADVKLGDNAQKEMSILFSDIRDFTTISEQMSPEESFRFINSYLNVVGPVIRRHDGFIDKYIGDAIMALFVNTADNAVDSAIDMLQILTDYNKGRKRAGYPPLSIQEVR